MPRPTPDTRSRLLIHLVWALLACVTFGAGYFAAMPSTADTNKSPDADPHRADRALDNKGSAAHPREGADEAAGAMLTADQAKVRAFNILSVHDPVERMRLICELIPSLTKDNWRGVLDAFSRQTATEFRLPTSEWNFLLERLGKVAGAEGLEEALASSGEFPLRARLLMTGWAEGDSQNALVWFQKQDPVWRKQLLEPLINGYSRVDSMGAMNLLKTFPWDEAKAFVTGVVENAIQRDGFRGSEQAFQALLSNPDGIQGMAGKVFIEMARRRILVDQMGSNPAEVLAWCDGYLRPNSPAGPAAIGELLAAAARKDPAATAKWLDERDTRLLPLQKATAYPTMAQAYLQASPDRFVAWIDQHQNHPQYNAMVQATVEKLYQTGKTEEAARLVSTVQGPEIRTQLEQTLGKLRSAPKARQSNGQ